MKIKYFLISLLCLAFQNNINAQKLEVSNPIESLEKSQLYGDAESGYVRVLKDKNNVIVSVLDSKTLKPIKTEDNKDILKNKWSEYYIYEINKKVLLFSFDFNKETNNTIFYQVLNNKTGQFGKEILLENFHYEQDYPNDGFERFKVFQSLDKKNLFIVYHQVQDKRDFSKFKINTENKDFLDFNLIVLNEELERVFEKEVFFDNLIYWHNFKNFIYDKKNNNVYLSMRYILRGGYSKKGVAIVEGDNDFAEILKLTIADNNLYTTGFYRNNEDKIFLFGVYFDGSKQKNVFLSYDVVNLEKIDQREFLIENHPTLKKDILNKNFVTIKTRILQIEEYNNEIYMAYNIDYSNPRQNGYDRYKHLLNVALVKLDKNGNINTLKTTPISEEVYGELSGKKFCFQVQEDYVNGVFIDKFYNYKIDGKELDGNYLTAFTIDDENSINYSRLSNLKEINNPNYFTLEQCMYSKNTISSFMFIKKKQELVISVNFND